ncbi:malto-oligosyltrehalose synthase [soil metagenome]
MGWSIERSLVSTTLRLTNRDVAALRGLASTNARVPLATYRVQLHKDFPLSAAEKIIPYLSDLGISDVYASPIFASTPGSMHGYDVTDYSLINPELGGTKAFAALIDSLRDRHLRLIVDFVPNHMGIVGGSNLWWQDVLENGRTSPYADHFDIDWQPLKPELQDQVLVPVLGDHFGVALERGELKLVFEQGSFTVHYYSTPLPISPPTYPLILSQILEAAKPLFEPDALPLLELQSIIGSFERLAPNHATDPEHIAERSREQVVGKHRLQQLADAETGIRESIERVVVAINGQPGCAVTFDDLETLLNAQSYRPAYWRVAAEEINYRRFFAINELAAIRQEIPGVLDETHRALFELLGNGVVSGVRIDHPDGLWDPAGYFRDLQQGALLAKARRAIESRRGNPLDEETWDRLKPEVESIWRSESLYERHSADPEPHFHVVVEKILEPGEHVPEDWFVSGTVGYEFARVVTGLFVDGSNRKSLDDFYTRFVGERVRFSDLVYEQKKLIMRIALASEVNVLARVLDRLTEHDRKTRDYTLNSLRSAMREIIACFPVYRTYTVCGKTAVSTRDRKYIDTAVNEALRRNPAEDRGAFEFIRSALLLEQLAHATPEQSAEMCDFVMKFQQLSGPVMAKGLEDTAFYRFNRLISLNEVGGDPSTFGVSVSEFHQHCLASARRWPAAMLTSSTHDTKRSEDVRARISAISESPREWRAAVNRWSRMNRRHKTRLHGSLAPDRNDEYHLYQTLVGVWPFEPGLPDEALVERLATNMIKTVREAQVNSSWINPNDAYETALITFVRGILGLGRKNGFPADFLKVAGPLGRAGAFTSLSQQLLKLTAPGVPDIYQGTELWEFSLVDPDNRRAVDYEQRIRLLEMVTSRDPGTDLIRDLLEDLPSGAVKLYLTARTLKHRASDPELYVEGDYQPVDAEGPLAAHVVAFRRSLEDREIIVVAPRLWRTLFGQMDLAPMGEIWNGTTISLPESAAAGSEYVDLFSGRTLKTVDSQERSMLNLGDVLAEFPVALISRPPVDERARSNRNVEIEKDN